MGSKLDKAKARLKASPNDYTYDEARRLLSNIGYIEHNKGKTSGSRVIFIREDDKIMLHKPHPGNEMKHYAVRQLKEHLEAIGEL